MRPRDAVKRCVYGAALLSSCAAPAQPVVMHPRAACDMEDRVARALCVVHLFVEEARKRKDVIKLACLRDKEMQLEVLRDRLEDADRAVKADKLERESERCIGELALHL